jgi:hypothetical protein
MLAMRPKHGSIDTGANAFLRGESAFSVLSDHDLREAVNLNFGILLPFTGEPGYMQFHFFFRSRAAAGSA